MSGTDDKDKGQTASDPSTQSDDDAWGEAAAQLSASDEPEAVAAEPKAEQTEPEAEQAADGEVSGEISSAVDDDWSMSAPAAKPTDDLGPARLDGAALPPEPEPESVREPEPEPEPEPDYAAQARQWREDLNTAVGIPQAEKASQKRSKKKAQRAAAKPARDKRERGPGGGGGGRLSSRSAKIAMAVGAVAVVLGIIIVLGWFNSRDYYLVCGSSEITAEQGNGFPPWGTSTLGGDRWRPIAIPEATECGERKTADIDELEGWYLDALHDQAGRRLGSAQPDKIDLAESQLKQALLFTRKPERADTRKQILRLLGDVEYWRAAAQVRQAKETLEQAGARFGGAAKKLPRFQSDSSAWADFAAAISEELVRGPPELRPKQDQPIKPTDQPNFTGTGPDSPVIMPDAGVGLATPPGPDAQPGVMLPPPLDAAPPPPDAGLPRGGVLL